MTALTQAKSAPTPGPWVGFVLDGSYSILPAGRSGEIATGIGNEHDANLFLAAPDLLHSMKRILYWLDNYDTDVLQIDDVEAVRAAISKAEGSQ